MFTLQDELETHSKPESISIFVHYGGDRSTDPKVIAEPDVVLTTYGVLTAAYKDVSIFAPLFFPSFSHTIKTCYHVIVMTQFSYNYRTWKTAFSIKWTGIEWC